jgi:hypothetical protein
VHGNGLAAKGVVFDRSCGCAIVLHFIRAARKVVGCQGAGSVSIHRFIAIAVEYLAPIGMLFSIPINVAFSASPIYKLFL